MRVVSDSVPLLKLHSTSLSACPRRALVTAAAPSELQAVAELAPGSTARVCAGVTRVPLATRVAPFGYVCLCGEVALWVCV